MKGITCPFCNEKVYSSYWPNPGKVKCLYCQQEFSIGYDKLKHTWISTDPKSPI